MNPPEQNDDLDQIGDWPVDKLGYSTAKGTARFRYGYIDGFGGAGEHVHESTGKIIPGSPLNALNLAKKSRT